MGHNWKQDKRKNIIIVGTVVFISILVVTLVIFLTKKPKFPKDLGLTIHNNDYYLEIAQNDKERKKGLSDRNKLCSNCGMLFIFDKEKEQGIWMKDTHIPLDIIWLNSQKQIIKIITAAQTESETIYLSQKPAKYVIELPANESLKLNLQIGDTIPFFDDE